MTSDLGLSYTPSRGLPVTAPPNNVGLIGPDVIVARLMRVLSERHLASRSLSSHLSPGKDWSGAEGGGGRLALCLALNCCIDLALCPIDLTVSSALYAGFVCQSGLRLV